MTLQEPALLRSISHKNPTEAPGNLWEMLLPIAARQAQRERDTRKLPRSYLPGLNPLDEGDRGTASSQLQESFRAPSQSLLQGGTALIPAFPSPQHTKQQEGVTTSAASCQDFLSRYNVLHPSSPVPSSSTHSW